MIAVSYEYYTDEYGGTLVKEDRFPFLLKKSGLLLSNITLGRADKVEDGNPLEERLKDCLCSMCDTLQTYESDTAQLGGIKKSESVGKWSVSYDISAVPKTAKSACLRDAEEYLGDTELMCRWV